MIPKLLLLINEIRCFVSLIIIKILQYKKNTKLKSSLLPFEVHNMSNGDLSTDLEFDNRSNTNLSLHHALDQVDLNNNLLDKVILTEDVLRPTKKPKSVGPHKSISKKNGNQRKSHLRNKKFRSASKPLYGITM